jgi:hypothetical protein
MQMGVNQESKIESLFRLSKVPAFSLSAFQFKNNKVDEVEVPESLRMMKRKENRKMVPSSSCGSLLKSPHRSTRIERSSGTLHCTSIFNLRMRLRELVQRI